MSGKIVNFFEKVGEKTVDFTYNTVYKVIDGFIKAGGKISHTTPEERDELRKKFELDAFRRDEIYKRKKLNYKIEMDEAKKRIIEELDKTHPIKKH